MQGQALATKAMADSGSENINEEVDELLRDEELTRVLAQVEVTFSNSLIEAFCVLSSTHGCS
jgi:hypothetical protein